jgi:hypothetical protein
MNTSQPISPNACLILFFALSAANLFTQSHCRSDFLLRCHELTTDGGGEMISHFINEPDHWRARAEEARMLANQMNDSLPPIPLHKAGRSGAPSHHRREIAPWLARRFRLRGRRRDGFRFDAPDAGLAQSSDCSARTRCCRSALSCIPERNPMKRPGPF